MRITSDQFGDELMKDIEGDQSPASNNNRLDQVAEMVDKMEKSITDKIEQANKRVIERLENKEDVPEYTENLSEIKDDIEEDSNNEDNRVSDSQSEE